MKAKSPCQASPSVGAAAQRLASIPGADESAISSSTAQEQSRVAAQVLSEEEAEYELGEMASGLVDFVAWGRRCAAC